jgi:hypothetical protein
VDAEEGSFFFCGISNRKKSVKRNSLSEPLLDILYEEVTSQQLDKTFIKLNETYNPEGITILDYVLYLSAFHEVKLTPIIYL